MLILKWKQSHWWIVGFGGVGWGRGMSSYLDVKELNHRLHQRVWVLPFVSDHGVVGSRCWLWEERWIADEGQCPCHFQVVGTSTLMVTRDFIYLFFLKMLLLIVFFLRTGLFPSSLGISIVFIEDLLNAQDCVKCLWVLFLWFMMSDYNPLGWGNSSEGTHLCLTDEATEVQRSEDNCPGNSE